MEEAKKVQKEEIKPEDIGSLFIHQVIEVAIPSDAVDKHFISILNTLANKHKETLTKDFQIGEMPQVTTASKLKALKNKTFLYATKYYDEVDNFYKAY
jgi:hypothetical protein